MISCNIWLVIRRDRYQKYFSNFILVGICLFENNEAIDID